MIFCCPARSTASPPLLRGEALADLFTSVYDSDEAQTAKLVWSVPKFDVNSDLELTDTLKMLGVTDVKPSGRTSRRWQILVVAVTQVQHAARGEDRREAARSRRSHRHHGERDLGDAGSAGREMNLDRPFSCHRKARTACRCSSARSNTME